jgi:hypothetical protein
MSIIIIIIIIVRKEDADEELRFPEQYNLHNINFLNCDM